MSQEELFDPMRCDIVELLDHLPDIDTKHAWPKMLADLVDIVTHRLRRLGRDDETTLLEAQAVIISIAEFLGGRMLYLPRNESLRLALRDNLIWKELGKLSVPALADKNHLTPMQVYNIIREQRALHRGRVQRELFGEEGES